MKACAARLSSPADQRLCIAVMVEYARQTRERWREGETLDIAPEMMRLTLASVGKTLFDAQVESQASEIGAALTQVMQLFDRITNPLGGGSSTGCRCQATRAG